MIKNKISFSFHFYEVLDRETRQIASTEHIPSLHAGITQ
jgi:hypothetical protein